VNAAHGAVTPGMIQVQSCDHITLLQTIRIKENYLSIGQSPARSCAKLTNQAGASLIQMDK
jgi:hypothetical protein